MLSRIVTVGNVLFSLAHRDSLKHFRLLTPAIQRTEDYADSYDSFGQIPINLMSNCIGLAEPASLLAMAHSSS